MMIEKTLDRTARTDQPSLAAEMAALIELVEGLPEPARIALAGMLARRYAGRQRAGGVDPDQCAGPLCDELWAYCGRRKMAWLRTRINQRLEAETGKRSPAAGGGQDRVARAAPGGDA
jgi:hypothetical protein